MYKFFFKYPHKHRDHDQFYLPRDLLKLEEIIGFGDHTYSPWALLPLDLNKHSQINKWLIAQQGF